MTIAICDRYIIKCNKRVFVIPWNKFEYIYISQLLKQIWDVKSILNVDKSTILEEFVTLHGQTLRTLLILQTGEQWMQYQVFAPKIISNTNLIFSEIQVGDIHSNDLLK